MLLSLDILLLFLFDIRNSVIVEVISKRCLSQYDFRNNAPDFWPWYVSGHPYNRYCCPYIENKKNYVTRKSNPKFWFCVHAYSVTAHVYMRIVLHGHSLQSNLDLG